MKYLVVAFSLISAIFWSWSACVKIPTGFDTDEAQANAHKKIGKINAAGAAFAALAAICSAFSN